MYHIRNDVRAEKSAHLLYEGLQKILAKKEFGKITVSDISKESTVSRATFYRNFDEIIDILSWKCDREFHSVLTGFVESVPPLEHQNELLSYVLKYWMAHIDILEILMNIGRLDIIYNGFVNNSPVITDYLELRGVHMDLENFDYFISVRAGFFVGIIRAWINAGKTQSAEEVSEIVQEQFRQAAGAKLIV